MAISFPPFGNNPKPRTNRRGSPSLRSAMPPRLPSGVSRRAKQPGNASEAQNSGPQAHPVLDPQIQFRLLLVWGVLMVGGFGLVLNLVRLQIVQAAMLQEKAKLQQVISLRPFIPRRPITDHQGNVLAIDQPAYTLYAHPKLFQNSQQAIAQELAPILGQPERELVKLLNSAESGIQVHYALPENVANRIKDLQLDGLELIQHQQRFYPQQNLFASVVGYVNLDREGQAGIEYGQQNLLERSVQAIQLNLTGTGSILPTESTNPLLQQDDLRLQLTLDSRVQRATRLALHRQIQKYSAKRGLAMVMDVHDGAIVAMAMEPTYDPNQYYKFNFDNFRNWAVSDTYEPGSTFKPINIAIALETGSIRSDDVFYDEGRIQVGGWPIQNSDYNERGGGRGSLTVQEILQYSSNVGMVRIMQRVDPSIYYSWLEKIGLAQKTGVDLPSETAGQIKSKEEFTSGSIEPATTAFGQGFTLTPIQLLQLHGVLANGGMMVTPHVVQGLYNANGQLYWEPKRPAPRRIFSSLTTETVLSMMESAVQKGTGEAAKIAGYRIAGKTGTAQKVDPSGGYHDYARITSFVSIFPAEDPRYVVLVVIDEPQGENAYGSTVAAPIAKSVMEALIAIEGIPPSQPQVEETPPQ